MPVFDMEIAGQNVKIEVDSASGRFTSRGLSEYVSADTLPELTDKIRRVLAKKRVVADVEVTIIKYGGPKRIRLTRFSADKREILTKKVGGTTADDSISTHETVYQRFTDAEIAEYADLVKRKTEIENALTALRDRKLMIPGRPYQSTASDVLNAALKKLADAKVAKESATTAAEVDATAAAS